MPLPPRIRALLAEHTSLVLATARDGQPWTGAVFYTVEETADGVSLLCAVLASSRKLANLRANPRVAVFIGPREPTRWIQAEGTAPVVDEPAAAAEAVTRLTTAVPAARVLTERAPVVPVRIHLGSITLTDLTGGRPRAATGRASGSDR